MKLYAVFSRRARGNCLIRLTQYPPLGMATLDSVRKLALPCYRRLPLPAIDKTSIVLNYSAGHRKLRGLDHPGLSVGLFKGQVLTPRKSFYNEMELFGPIINFNISHRGTNHT